MANIKCDTWECANNGGGWCKLGDTEFTELIICDGECQSYEPKEADNG